ncbi:O-Methyltransferase involved in polyketide biosynthesis [Legionella lansingensis]|uniref:Leucine carboxyl methyltransferase n=1 Tax=Legionella lansingensis TaxID=45067 RepID=A0A0W0VLT4_9GAMM|nr:class I SAM-dependent methyltransferase [Legionella lansingensis]KTD20990.1 Leucine carboxyl methyltransferase [Legionella lansingensis]SNV44809.1 O-Methyltransferase involved in polyketide biosynthesis [Legionella lansingensis]
MQSKHESIPDDIKPSVTALSVAMAFARSLDTGHVYLFSKQELALIKHFVNIGKQSLYGFNWVLSESLSHMPYSIQQSFFNAVVVPGYDQLIMLRKLMIKNKIESAIEAGVEQIIFLGGGYDIRALVTALIHPDIRVYELDRGPTREHKIKGLKTMPQEISLEEGSITELSDGTISVGNNLKYIECDLGKNDLLNTLEVHGFEKEKKTLVIGEGLTMYLSQEENRALLTSLAKILKDNDEVLLSFMSEIASSKIAEASLKRSKETYRFSLAPQNVIAFVEESGFCVDRKFVAASMLDEVGDLSAADYHKKNKNRPKEYYYYYKNPRKN